MSATICGMQEFQDVAALIRATLDIEMGVARLPISAECEMEVETYALSVQQVFLALKAQGVETVRL